MKSMSHSAMKRLVIALVLAAFAAPLLAQGRGDAQVRPEALGRTVRRPPPPSGPAPRLADGTIDLGGLWLGGGAIGDLEAQGGLKRGDIPVLPWVKEYMAKLDPNMEPSVHCLPMGIPRKWAYPWRMIQEPVPGKGAKRMYMLEEGGIHSYRQIFMDGRKHPAEPEPSWNGHSIAWWEGDTLVIDTVGFNGKVWMDRRGFPQTEKAHTIERYTRVNMGTLEIVVTIDDPDAYLKPFTVKFAAQLSNPQDEIMEFICQENNQVGIAGGYQQPHDFPVVKPPPGAATRP